MKILNTFFAILFTLTCGFQLQAQSPQEFNYQAVVRDASGNVLPNQAVSFQMNIREGAASGTTVYSETHTATTNGFGLVNLQIGTGTVVSGTFANINWGGNSHFIEIELDENGGTNYIALGTQQLISVPYALHAKTVENDAVDDADADPANELQNLSISNDTLSISNVNFVVLPPATIDTDDQTLSLSNDSLFIQDGNGVDLSGLSDTLWQANGNHIYNTNPGRVGIGTQNPQVLLHIRDSSATLRVDDIDQGSRIILVAPGDTYTGGVGTTSNHDLPLFTNNVDRVLISSTGNVGVGTSTPGEELHVVGNIRMVDGNQAAGLVPISDANGTMVWTDPGTITTVNDSDWVPLSGNNVTNGNSGNIGIGDMSSPQCRWQLTVRDTVNSMLNADSIDASELHTVFTRNLNQNNTGVGIGFQSTTTSTGVGAAIVHERTNSNSRGKLHFATKSSGSANDEDLPIRMTLDESGRLGIGTTSPTEKLHLSGGNILADRDASTGSLSRSLTLGGARSGDSKFASIDFQNYDSNNGQTDYVGASIQANNGGDATDNGNLRFLTYNGTLSEQMRITEEGRVGMGEPDPQTTLDVVDEAVIGNISVGSQSTDQSNSNLNGLGFTSTPWVYTSAIEAQDERGSSSTLITLGNDGTYGSSDEIHMVTSGNAQVTIASNGRVGLDETAPAADLHIKQSAESFPDPTTGGIILEKSNGGSEWQIWNSNNNFSFAYNGTRVAYVSSGSGAWTTTSDRSLKQDISEMGNVLPKVRQLRTVEYHYKHHPEGPKVKGFIAQEVEKVFPELVSRDAPGGLRALAYSDFAVLSIKAVQEQQEVIERQNEELKGQREEISQLKAEMEALKEWVKNEVSKK